MVLLIVLSMLTLFAAVGLGFVYYANDVAIAARTHRESVNRPARSDGSVPLPSAPHHPSPSEVYDALGAPAGPDSFWLDVGGPVLRGADSRAHATDDDRAR
jgi:hypothetical protein